jgi:hypothetical protein
MAEVEKSEINAEVQFEQDEPEVIQEEKFEEPLHSSLGFTSKWGVWEHYEGGDFENSMKKVAWFGDAIGFAEAWANLPHSNIENFFYNSETNKIQL